MLGECYDLASSHAPLLGDSFAKPKRTAEKGRVLEVIEEIYTTNSAHMRSFGERSNWEVTRQRRALPSEQWGAQHPGTLKSLLGQNNR